MWTYFSIYFTVLRCGRLVLPKEFNELELLQLEADFYQIEDLISAVEDRKKEVKVKETDDAHLLVFAIIFFKTLVVVTMILLKYLLNQKKVISNS